MKTFWNASRLVIFSLTIFATFTTSAQDYPVVQTMDVINVTDTRDIWHNPGQVIMVSYVGPGGGPVSVPEPLDQVGRRQAGPDLCAKIQSVYTSNSCATKSPDSPNSISSIQPSTNYSYFLAWQNDILSYAQDLYNNGSGYDAQARASTAFLNSLSRCSETAEPTRCRGDVERYFGVAQAYQYFPPATSNQLLVNRFSNGMFCAAVAAQGGRNSCKPQ
jgi:hypothetical protein